jgi:hypothetical protein
LTDADQKPVEIAWDAIVSNASRVTPADHQFYLNGAKMPYQDRKLVWKGDSNINVESVREHFGLRPVDYRNSKGELKESIVATRNVNAA